MVTNNRVTAGISANLYAKTTEKNWEASSKCENVDDIASQLINGKIGKELKVIFGGGRKNFYPDNIADEETGEMGLRKDGKNLIEDWKKSKENKGNAVYITKSSDFKNLNTSDIDYLMGLFEYDQLKYNLEINEKNLTEEPSLVHLTHYSLEMLQKQEHKNGFLLLIDSK